MSVEPLAPPEPIAADHELEQFSCGQQLLDEWLKHRALKNELTRASKTFVVCSGRRVVGYYCLSAGAVVRASAPKLLQRNMPDPVPVFVLGRLAVDESRQGRGIGQGLLKDAVHRSARAAETVGAAAVLVHAISDEAKRFYLLNGFLPSAVEPMTLCLPISRIIAER